MRSECTDYDEFCSPRALGARVSASSARPRLCYTSLGADRIRPGIRSGYRDVGSFALDDVLLAVPVEHDDLLSARGDDPTTKPTRAAPKTCSPRAGMIPGPMAQET